MFTHDQLVRILAEEQNHIDSLYRQDYIGAEEAVSRELSIGHIASRLGVSVAEYRDKAAELVAK